MTNINFIFCVEWVVAVAYVVKNRVLYFHGNFTGKNEFRVIVIFYTLLYINIFQFVKLMQYIFRFPADTERREKWLHSIGYINLYKNARICSDHFTENDYYTCDILSHKSSRRLKKTAIPSVFTQR